MGESDGRSSTISGSSEEKLRESRNSARGKRKSGDDRLHPLLSELARLAEMSAIERRLRQLGFRVIAGTDEVGRGCLAGPVVAAAVILDPCSPILGIDDSKRLPLGARLSLFRVILRNSLAVSVGAVEPSTIDRINILEASKLAMVRAVDQLELRPEILILDAVFLEKLTLPQVSLIKGDSRSVAVAAASIVAKVYRDFLMESYHGRYPQYDFARNRGYGTENHRNALNRYGPSPIHRMSFEGLCERRLFD